MHRNTRGLYKKVTGQIVIILAMIAIIMMH
nr:MAG TPA: hypothetical protein [Caudoviricetes sp.]